MGRSRAPVQVWCLNVEKPFANPQPDSLQSNPHSPRSFRRASFLFCIRIGDVLMHRFPALTAFFVAAACAAVLIPSPAPAQEPGNVPETKAPAPPPPNAWEIE